MQLIITDSWLAKSRSFQLSTPQIILWCFCFFLSSLLIAAALYYAVFLKAAREGWPVLGSLVRYLGQDELAQRDRYMRENIELMAKKLGEMQAKMSQLESLGERVSGLAGLDPALIRIWPGQGGAVNVSRDVGLSEMQLLIDGFDKTVADRGDSLQMIETQLFEQKLKKMMLPTQAPVVGITRGSGFGWRIDPFRGVFALHEGLDFPATVGTPIYSAAGGVVVTQELQPQFGNLIEIGHGNDLLTRYAHTSRVFVKKGDLVKRGQKIAEVGTTGRSTGPHLHFEVLVRGVPQDPQVFLKMPNSANTALSSPKR